jgi:sec-independent protein translocase protein TatA
MGLSLPHILVIVILVFLLFGANRFPNMMGDLAKGIKSFKQGLKDEDEKPETPEAPKALTRDKKNEHIEDIEHTPDHTDRT